MNLQKNGESNIYKKLRNILLEKVGGFCILKTSGKMLPPNYNKMEELL
jgi:hypothetical protein